MNRLLKSAVLGLAATATTLTVLPAAQAGDGWRRHHHHHNDSGDLVTAGVLGLAVGALAAGVATAPQPDYYEYEAVPVYRDPPPRRIYVAPARRVVYAEGALEPWTPAWYDYCESRYRSFNPRSGTFIGYDGLSHFCAAD
jgi:hypothetical protein